MLPHVFPWEPIYSLVVNGKHVQRLKREKGKRKDHEKVSCFSLATREKTLFPLWTHFSFPRFSFFFLVLCFVFFFHLLFLGLPRRIILKIEQAVRPRLPLVPEQQDRVKKLVKFFEGISAISGHMVLKKKMKMNQKKMKNTEKEQKTKIFEGWLQPQREERTPTLSQTKSEKVQEKKVELKDKRVIFYFLLATSPFLSFLFFISSSFLFFLPFAFSDVFFISFVSFPHSLFSSFLFFSFL